MRIMTDIEATAVSKIGKTHDLGENTEHEVDFYLHVRGTMKQGASYSSVVPAAANMQAILLVALSKLNATTAESIVALVEEAARLEDAEDGTMDAELKKVKEYADTAMQRIKESTRRPCKGKLTAKISAVVVPAEAVDKNKLGQLAA